MSFVLESGCKGIAFFDTMQDFRKEKCNIYLVFNKCLHIKQPFVGAHIVFITRGRVGVKGRTTIEEGANTDRTDTTDFVGLLKRFEMFLGGLGMFGGFLGGYAGLARRLRRCSNGSKNEHG